MKAKTFQEETLYCFHVSSKILFSHGVRGPKKVQIYSQNSYISVKYCYTVSGQNLNKRLYIYIVLVLYTICSLPVYII